MTLADRFRRTPSQRFARLTVVVIALLWGGGAYVRSLFHSEPRPSLEGVGLLLLVLNATTVALPVGAVVLRHCGSAPWRRAAAVALLLGAMAASLWLYALSPRGGGGIVFSMIALWMLVGAVRTLWGIALGAATIAAVGVIGAVAERHHVDFGLLAAYAGVALGSLASIQREAAQEATRRAEAANAMLAERSRIAREIHDILAHSLSAQIVHLEGARMLLARDGDRVRALDRVERAQRLARSGLEETRRALATLRGDAPEPEQALAELAEEFHASTGRACEVEVAGTPRELSPQAGLAVVRTAQEALTNVRRHAPGARARVVLRYGDDAVELDVTDSGGTESVLEASGGGYGLVGMRERAELIGGTLETGPEEKGFRVSLRVPV